MLLGQENAQIRQTQNYAATAIKSATQPVASDQEKLPALKALENVLRKDQIQAKESQDSQLQFGRAAPTREQAKLQSMYAPQPTQYGGLRNPLGDYSRLTAQMDGLQNSTMDGFLLSTLETRRGVARIADDTQDGYSMLANTFGLEETSKKTQKKAMKRPRLSAATQV